MKRALIYLSAAVFVLLGVLHLNYPLPYVYRVMVYQDADFDDIFHFPASEISASGEGQPLTFERSAWVAEAFEQHPGINDLASFIEATSTSALLVMRDGRLIEERYGRGYGPDSRQNTFSVAKSVMSVLVGIAIRDQHLELTAPVTRYLPELATRDARFAEITVEHLLDMRSGIEFSSQVEFPFFTADNPLIYYSLDLEKVVLEKTRIARPPGEFKYTNYNPPLLGLVLRRTTGVTPSAYLEANVWQPLGATDDAGWTTDEHGVERMESGFYATARDLVRFGWLLAQDGAPGLDGRELIPADWIAKSTTPIEHLEAEEYNGRRWGYRLGWWIVPRPDGRPDFCAIGRYGQFIYISPQYGTVIVRNGPDRGDWGDRDWTELFYSVVSHPGVVAE